MTSNRKCKRSGCAGSAIATLTYVYKDSLVVLGPLSVYAEPHSYDLCEMHVCRLTVPKGWELLRLDFSVVATDSSQDDLLALDYAIRKIPRAEHSIGEWEESSSVDVFSSDSVKKGHLRSIVSKQDDEDSVS